MVGGPDMADATNVRWDELVVPAGAAQQEAVIAKYRRRCEKERIDAGFAVRQAVCEKAEIAAIAAAARDRIVCRRVESIVDRDAHASPDLAVPCNDGVTAAIGQNQIVEGNAASQMMGGIGADQIGR